MVQARSMGPRLDEPPPLRVQSAIARQQSVPEQPPGTGERSPLDEPVLVGHEHLLDVFRVVQQKDTIRTKPDVRNRAEFSAGSGQECERIAANLGKVAEQQTPAWPWWKHMKSYPALRDLKAILTEMIVVVLNPCASDRGPVL
jgi:hypothetical protein